jgi:PAS domain-containing protein
MSEDQLKSDYASAERASEQEIQEDVLYLNNLPIIQEFLNIIPDVFLILNTNRQIVYANQIVIDMLSLKSPDDIYGLRPGEALHCIHSNITEGGCGTTIFCRYCGAVNAILKSQTDPKNIHIEECRISSGEEEAAFDFRVWSKVITLENKPYTVFVVRDISDEKRRSVLEKTFFHDILNTAGGIQGIMGIWDEATDSELDELIKLVKTASSTIIEEIRMQKDLLAAESGDLVIEKSSTDSLYILEEVKRIYQKHEVAEGKTIEIDPDANNVSFESDSRILKRIISNMLKNALEATTDGGTVTMGVNLIDNNIKFWVHNSAVMPEAVQMQMFQRSFSTKGSGRGIGTYSIKMLGEKYLKGKVSFSSKPEEGTIVVLLLPI